MNPINIAISVPSWSLQWDNVAIFFNNITFPVCHSAQNPLQRKVVVVIFVNKVESFKSTPCTALNQNVFLLWNMDFYLSFWNKKAWAINSFGSVPSIRFIGVSRKEGVELLARQLNIFDAVLSRSIIVQEQTWNIVWMCFPWKLLARQTFLGEILCRHLNSIWVDETRCVCIQKFFSLKLKWKNCKIVRCCLSRKPRKISISCLILFRTKNIFFLAPRIFDVVVVEI